MGQCAEWDAEVANPQEATASVGLGQNLSAPASLMPRRRRPSPPPAPKLRLAPQIANALSRGSRAPTRTGANRWLHPNPRSAPQAPPSPRACALGRQPPAKTKLRPSFRAKKWVWSAGLARFKTAQRSTPRASSAVGPLGDSATRRFTGRGSAAVSAAALATARPVGKQGMTVPLIAWALVPWGPLGIRTLRVPPRSLGSSNSSARYRPRQGARSYCGTKY